MSYLTAYAIGAAARPSRVRQGVMPMIRRVLQSDDGAPGWLLIPQVEHALLARQLAHAWGAEPFLPVPVREVTLPAIGHHDDGWAEWDRSVHWNGETGYPLSFLEMETSDLDRIWETSIQAVAPWGPLAQMMVARHFCELREDAGQNPADRGDAFLGRFQPRWRQWLREWVHGQPAIGAGDERAAAADLAFRCLRFFDRLSLSLCCDRLLGEGVIETPCQRNVTLAIDSPPGVINELVVRPWGWQARRLCVSVQGRWLARGPYGSARALDASLSRAIRLTWTLRP